MSDEQTQGDAYYEVQVDRETLVLIALGLLAVLVAAFLVGRWTAPREDGPTPEDATAAAGTADHVDERLLDVEPAEEDVDGVPQFGGTPVSVEGAPPISPVPSKPLPERGSPEPPASDGPARAASAASAATGGPETSAGPAAGTSEKPAATGEGWVVQVSAVTSSRDAERLRVELAKKGWPVRVVRESGYSKVQVGPFKELGDAQAAERRLKREERLSTWVKPS